MEDLGLNCSVCEERFSDNRIPRNLGCGHSLCTPCVSEVLARDKKCPECRRTFTTSSASELAVNFPLLKLARSLYGTVTSLQLQAASVSAPDPTNSCTLVSSSATSGTELDAGRCRTHGSLLYLRCMRCNVWICESCVTSGHYEPPRGQCRVLPLPQALVQMKRTHLQTSSSKIKFAEKLKRRIEKEVSSLGAVREQHATTVGSLMAVIQEVEVVAAEVEASREDSKKRLLEVEKVFVDLQHTKSIVKAAVTLEEMTAATVMAGECLTAVERCLLQDQHRNLPKVPKIVSLSKQTLRAVLDIGNYVYGSLEVDGRQLWARVTERDHLLHLHALKALDHPPLGLIVPFDTVRQLVPRESPSIFLEVAWAGQLRGRVYVRMFGDTPRCQQAQLLCAGERGVSYSNTSFYRVDHLNTPREILRGGDYENNDGTGGRALVNGIISGGVYTTEVTAGLVAGCSSEGFASLACFGIYLRDNPDHYDKSGFGIVTSGIETLKAAARRKTTAEAKVLDCGLVIPM
ncbi:uncharacterized protein LOC121862886 [Homarus americanus]|uniref:Peptidyl-prolyl cis-trans isomerase A1-like n=1 Tax=Homarus americanus TaxID=6706 RepID=A0A8J5TCD0_HOMAM|nr:uncharacterized protein LOC121862886 [Homarus americanus]KAG7171573.1 Peptidyl-prolyl cis-trans isomerase A1-like [Homarus americanus]